MEIPLLQLQLPRGWNATSQRLPVFSALLFIESHINQQWLNFPSEQCHEPLEV